MRSSRRVVGAAVVAALCACNLVFPLDDYHAGDDAQAIDAVGSDASDAGASDALEAAAPFCASQPANIFCSDFDESADAASGFDLGFVQNGSGSSFTTTTVHLSPPNGAQGVANAFDAGDIAGARLEQTLWAYGASHASLDCQLEWQPVATSPVANDYANVIEIAFWDGPGETTLITALRIFLQNDGTLRFSEGSTQTNHTVTIPITPTSNTWFHVDMLVSITSSTYQVVVGGISAPGSALSVPVGTTSHAIVEIGPGYFGADTTSPSPGWTFDYDNVVCR